MHTRLSTLVGALIITLVGAGASLLIVHTAHSVADEREAAYYVLSEIR